MECKNILGHHLCASCFLAAIMTCSYRWCSEMGFPITYGSCIPLVPALL